MFQKFLAVIVCAILPTMVAAQGRSTTVAYYGEAFYRSLSQNMADDALKNALRAIMRSDHRLVTNGYDQILQGCSGQGCYRHTPIGYDRARVFLLGYFYLVQNGGSYGVRDVYCERVYGPNDFRGRKPGPQMIPDHNVVNVEHTWPKSRFSGRFPAEEQMSDLHHLYPTDSQMNAIRSSFQFGEVATEAHLPCATASFGRSARGTVMFEPPEAHKGNVARALFYFSTRYQLQIAPEEEAFLRMWNQQDPVDQEEMTRNNEIHKAQGSRNPFIDHPDLAMRIRDF